MPGWLDLRSLFVCAAFVAAGGCMRGGCDVGPPAEQCTDSRECDAPSTCYRGYCSSQYYVENDRRCRAQAACLEEGECGALTVRSFLGLDSSLECGAVEASDCAASRACVDHGRCALGDGNCYVPDDAACARSRRCESHEQCSLLASERTCVRRWPACEPLVDPQAPEWARRFLGQIPADMKRMPGPWQPGALESAIVACELELARGWASRLRVGGRCTTEPGSHGDRGPETFVLGGVRLRPGDSIAAASERGDAGWTNHSFLRATYTGASPVKLEGADGSLVCHVVTPAAARPIGLEALVDVDRDIAAARRLRPNEDQLLAAPLDAVRRSLAVAGVWLGWSAPEVVARIAAMAAVERAWGAALLKVFAKMRKAATPPRTVATSEESLSLEVLGHVCGAELDARREPAARRGAKPEHCGLELKLVNLGAQPMEFHPSSPGLLWIEDAIWLVGAGEVGEIVDVVMLDIRGAAAHGRHASVAPGESAVLLLAGEQRDLSLADGSTLLHVRRYFGDEFTLRTELVKEPPLKGRAGKRRR